MRTRSEDLFERFCSDERIPFCRLEVGLERTPDYEVQPNSHRIAVEVKQLDRDEESWLKEGEVKLYSTVPGEHIRRKINKAGTQLHVYADEGRSSLLVIYNNIYRVLGVYTEPYDFLVAMYGLQSVVIGVPKGGSPYVKGQHFGGKRKMTNTTNTSFSALACLRENEEERLSLDIFHNAYASVPLDAGAVVGNNIRHFAIPKDAQGFAQWEEVK